MSKDREHFDDYREQTRIKHEILTKYFTPYFLIRAKAPGENLVYIDGFAGAGTYQTDDGAEHGSPLSAFADFKPSVAKKMFAIFVEKDKVLFKRLDAAVAEHFKTLDGLRPPAVVCGAFDEHVTGLLDRIKLKKTRLAPSFLFADPCGVDGLCFATLTRYLRDGDGEALLFFNYSGVNRIAGLPFKPGKTLSKLLGDDDTAEELAKLVKGGTPEERENAIVSCYLSALTTAVPDLYCTAFRVEHEDKKATSHYLIHLSRDARGFRIMKEVMWKLGDTDGGSGGLALEQASTAVGAPLFRPEWDQLKESILATLTKGQRDVDYFYTALSENRGNRLCAPAYKQALLELESEERILVRNRFGVPTTANTRMKRLGAPTLGKGHCVALTP